MICPNETQLAGFVQGFLPEPEIRHLEDHLSRCTTCGDTVRLLHENDTVMGLVRDVDPDVSPNLEPRVMQLVQDLKQLPSSSAASIMGQRTLPSDQDIRVDEIVRLFSPSESDDELGRLGHYRILRLLGIGGMGVVFQAEDIKLRRLVAIKILRPSLGETARARFLQEARSAAAIDHDNVITIYDVGTENGLAYLAMQWLEGETLEQRLQREESLPASEVRRIAAEVADGLSAAHSKKLIHRDIKPDNVWLEADRGRARILDFGLARIADEDSHLTETGMIAGTPAYMSPEQAQGRTVDERTDLFSLGSTIYRMLTGRLPFESTNPLATIRAIQSDQPTSVLEFNNSVPSDLSETVDRLMAKEAEQRAESAAAVATALRDCRPAPVVRPGQVKQPVGALDDGGNRGKRWGVSLVAALLAFAGWLSAPTIYRVATNQGTFEVESNDPDVEVQVLNGGNQVAVLDGRNNKITIEAGEYNLRIADPSSHATVSPGKVTLSRNEVEVLTVKVVSPKLDKDLDSSAGDLSGYIREPNATVAIQPPQAAAPSPGADLSWERSSTTERTLESPLTPNKDLEKQFGIPGLIAVLGADPARISGLPTSIAVDGGPDEGTVYLTEANGYVGTFGLFGLQRPYTEEDTLDLFRAHEKRCLDVAVVEDGKWLVTACIDGSVRLWDISTPARRLVDELQIIDTPPENGNTYLHMRSAHGGVAVRSGDGIQYLRVSDDGKFLPATNVPLSGKKVPFEFAVSPDGKWLVICELTKEFTTGRRRGEPYKYHSAKLILWSLHEDGTIEFADDYKCRALKNLALHTNRDGQLDIVADDPIFLGDRVQYTWRISQHGDIQYVTQRAAKPDSFAASQRKHFPNYGTLIASDVNGKLVVEKQTDLEVRQIAELETGRLTAIKILDDRSIVAATRTALRRWRWSESKSTFESDSAPKVGHKGSINGLLFHGPTNSLLSSSTDQILSYDLGNRSWDKSIPQQLSNLRLRKGVDEMCDWHGIGLLLRRSEGKRNLLTGLWRDTASELQNAFEIEFGTDGKDDIWSATMNPQANILATGYWNGEIRLWSIDAGKAKKLATWSAEAGHVCDLAFSSDGESLVAALWRGSVKSWNWKSVIEHYEMSKKHGGELTLPSTEIIGRHEDVCRTLAFSKDGKHLASGGEDGRIQLYDWRERKQIRTLTQETEPHATTSMEGKTIDSLEFSAEDADTGTELISSDGRGRVTVWSIPEGHISKTWQLPGWVWKATRSPDGKVIAAGNDDGTVYLLRR